MDKTQQALNEVDPVVAAEVDAAIAALKAVVEKYDLGAFVFIEFSIEDGCASVGRCLKHDAPGVNLIIPPMYALAQGRVEDAIFGACMLGARTMGVQVEKVGGTKQ